jgi:hypothetical protein
LSVVFISGGCGGGSSSNISLIQQGRYYVLNGENFDYPDLSVSYNDSYIKINSFKKIGNNDYELSFSGLIFWRNSEGTTVHGSNVQQRTILMSRVDHSIYETKYSSDPYIWIEILDDKNIDLCSDEFLVGLIYDK